MGSYGSAGRLEVGLVFHSQRRTITEADVRMFIEATGADHPNHTDIQYCKEHPIFERPCAPGIQVLGVVDGHVAETITRSIPLSLNYGHDRVRYLRPVYPGDTVASEIEIVDEQERDAGWRLLTIEARAWNQNEELILVNVNKLLIKHEKRWNGDR